jgi:3D (Asp-Asp-Asp) domain-containing protein
VEEPDEPAEPETELQSLGTFRLTAYCSCPECCGQWADGITYTGTEATPDRTVAVDPTVIPLGSTVLIDGQEYVAEDVGGAIKGARIDIYFPTHQAALQFGVQYAEVDVIETK